MKKKLLEIFGPLILAIFMVVVLFMVPTPIQLTSPKTLASAATSMSENVLRGNALKNKAVASGKYIPFFGSSELSRFDAFHPSVMAKKYNRGYAPFLLGAPGTQSLIHALSMASMQEELKDKKVVFILSPQWFVKEGLDKNSFDQFFSELQTYQWLSKLETISPADTYLAQRLLDYEKIQDNALLSKVLTQVEHKQLPTKKQALFLQTQLNFLNREDELFSGIQLNNNVSKVKKQLKILPKTYDELVMDKLAKKIGYQKTSNNPFDIENSFYTIRLKSHIKKLKNSQKKWDYRRSPEFSDFELALAQLAKAHAKVLFIIPPVNKKWSDYTGLSQSMLKDFGKKINTQLTEQGFDQIVDFTDQANVPYFMTDTIHLGWRGWLAADQAIDNFLMGKQEAASYKIKDYFFSKDWQDKLEIEN